MRRPAHAEGGDWSGPRALANRHPRSSYTRQERTMDTARRWMSSPAIVVGATTPLPEARSQMREQRIRRLPVVDGAGQLVGIVTEGDINRVSDSPATDVREYNLYHRAGDLPIGD